MARKHVEITRYDFAEKGGEESIRRCTVQACVEIHAQAVALCPVNKQKGVGGQLRNSLMWNTGWGKEGGHNSQGGDKSERELTARPADLEGYVGTNTEYATYVEFGTRYQVAQPFLRPAAEIFRGSDAASVAKKYGQEAMKAEYDERKKKRI